MSRGRLVWVDETCRIIGEDHPNARLSDEDVDEIRRLHEDEGFGYERLVKRFGNRVSLTQIRRIANYETRIATRVRCKSVGN